ncbi:MAG: Fic family protein [Gammaproteobacteria bacterium]|nr:Fic family protein [Gammaproteobacteria bacterium]MDH5303653.1 Fic family protein [Gammaproteobacteria bacterium]MDH5322337.1 Fic family protein [Gammaproteobacteria bacterium]
MTDFNPELPNNALPDLPPPIELIESTEILKKCINARVALAELKQAAELIPNAAVLVNTLPLLEARASSEIENIVTTTDKLFEFADIAEDRADAATKEALRYRTALYEGTKMVQRGMLTTDMAIQICSTIKGIELDIRAESGTRLKNRMTGEVIYTPPVGQKLLIEKLDNWANFMQRSTNLDPLVRLAIQHYQFEAIHPFADGNGRTGRILNILFLVQQGLLDTPILYLSRYIISHKAAYYRLLQNVTREQAWSTWIMFVLEGVEETCIWTTEKIKAIRELMEHTAEFVQHKMPKIYTWELVELLFKQPYCRIGNLVDAGVAKRQTASVYLKQLCDAGILKEIKSGRENIFVHPKYIELLTGEENVWVYYAGVETETADQD